VGRPYVAEVLYWQGYTPCITSAPDRNGPIVTLTYNTFFMKERGEHCTMALSEVR
jgi:hypothetical protein